MLHKWHLICSILARCSILEHILSCALAFSIKQTNFDMCRKMEKFLIAMGLENLLQISLKTLDIQKMVCNQLHQVSSWLRDIALEALLLLSFRQSCWIREQMAVRDLQIHQMETGIFLHLLMRTWVPEGMKNFHRQFCVNCSQCLWMSSSKLT